MDDNTYECPNCGATIYPEMTRCPQCGQNMYPEEDVAGQAASEGTAPAWLSMLGPLLIGWMIAAGIITLVHFLMAAFIRPTYLAGWAKAILLLAGPFGALVGAYVGTNLNKQRSRLMGGIVGVFTIPVLVLFATYWVEVTPRLLFSPLGALVGFLTILAGVAGGWITEIFSPQSDWQEKWKVHGWEDLFYQDLLRKVRFNGSAADRLIEYERKQDPSASRLKLIQNAIERWERDNR
jgi:hypothetical protein